MKKKGFTLVELLAVIAILAILVIIALPNVIGLFQDARKNSFANEVREIFKQSESQWALDSYDISSSGTDHYYSNLTGSSPVCTKLNMSGRSNINYFIKRDASGKATIVLASDGTYQYEAPSGTVTIESIKNTDIKTVADLSASEKLTIKCTATGK